MNKKTCLLSVCLLLFRISTGQRFGHGTNIVREQQVIELADGKSLTGVAINLPSKEFSQIWAYLGVRYASLGGSSFSASTENGGTIRQIASPHRFRHSVAAFFYESPGGVQSMSSLPPVCPQHILEGDKYLSITQDHLLRLAPFLKHQNEDCLTMNIYSPQTGTTFNRPHRRPVLLFVHGESYEFGTGNAYDLSVLAGFSGTVCITLNYRLGILGFLSLKEGHSNGNFALFDLQAAILWIRTNIERFGGDPDQMTLMGYGHGAALIHLFSLSRLAQGAISKSIKRLILLNGSGLAPWATSNSAAEVNRALEKMLLGDLVHGITHNSSLKNLSLSQLQTTRVSPAGTSAATSEQHTLYNKAKGPIASQNRSEGNSSVRKPTLGELVFKQLKQLSVRRIIQLQNNLSDALCASRLGPVLSKHLFPSLLFSESSIFGATSSGNGPGTDRTGAIKWESTLFARADLLVGLVEKPGASFYRKSQWTDSLSAEKEQCLQNIFPHDPRAMAAVVDFFYENGDQEAFSEQSVDGRRPRSTELDQIPTILSDGLYLAPAVQTLQLHLSLKKVDRQPSTAKVRTFLAMFRHQSSANSAQTNQREMNKTTVTGSTFGEDLAYWMGAPLVNNKTMNLFPGPYTGDDAAVSRKLLFLLTTFIHKGHPNKGNATRPGTNDLPHWPEYNERTQAHLEIGLPHEKTRPVWDTFASSNDHMRVVSGVSNRKIMLWTQLLPRISGLPKLESRNSRKQNGSLINVNDSCNDAVRPVGQWNPVVGSVQSHLYFFHLRQREDELVSSLNWNITAHRSLPEKQFINRAHTKILESSLHENALWFSSLKAKSTAQLPNTTPAYGFVSRSSMYQMKPTWQRITNSPLTPRVMLFCTVATGTTLLLLNIIVFIGIYYQANDSRRILDSEVSERHAHDGESRHWTSGGCFPKRRRKSASCLQNGNQYEDAGALADTEKWKGDAKEMTQLAEQPLPMRLSVAPPTYAMTLKRTEAPYTELHAGLPVEPLDSRRSFETNDLLVNGQEDCLPVGPHAYLPAAWSGRK